jgi:hypothetical protein
MSKQLLLETISSLPYALREQVENYADYVEATADEAIERAGAQPTAPIRNELIFLAGLRRLWSLVSGQFWLLDRALALSGQLRLSGISVGGTVFIRNEGAHAELRQLRDALAAELHRLELSVVTTFASSEELVQFIVEEQKRGPR